MPAPRRAERRGATSRSDPGAGLLSGPRALVAALTAPAAGRQASAAGAALPPRERAVLGCGEGTPAPPLAVGGRSEGDLRHGSGVARCVVGSQERRECPVEQDGRGTPATGAPVRARDGSGGCVRRGGLRPRNRDETSCPLKPPIRLEGLLHIVARGKRRGSPTRLSTSTWERTSCPGPWCLPPSRTSRLSCTSPSGGIRSEPLDRAWACHTLPDRCQSGSSHRCTPRSPGRADIPCTPTSRC